MYEPIIFLAFLAALFVLPGMLMLYSDWKHRRGWFK